MARRSARAWASSRVVSSSRVLESWLEGVIKISYQLLVTCAEQFGKLTVRLVEASI